MHLYCIHVLNMMTMLCVPILDFSRRVDCAREGRDGTLAILSIGGRLRESLKDWNNVVHQSLVVLKYRNFVILVCHFNSTCRPQRNLRRNTAFQQQ